MQYHVLSIWWPEGWEPKGPGDVPNCAWQTELAPLEPLPLARAMELGEALTTVRALNRQTIDAAGERWFIVAGVEDEPVEAAGGDEGARSYRIRIVAPQSDATGGDCSGCPAHDLECATADWQGKACVLKATRSTG